MSFKKIASIVALAALPALAQASTIFESEALGGPSNNTIATAQDLGALTSSGIQVFGFRLDALSGTDSADFFKFTVSASSSVSFAVNTPSGPDEINDPVVGLYDATGVQLQNDDDEGPGYDSFMSLALAAGTYYVAVSGFNDFSFQGGANTNTNWPYELAITTAVPEPESYAMLLAGLGILGGIARRRTSK